MTKRPHHMIFYSRDADSQLFMNLAIAQSIDAAHQKNAAGLLGHGYNGMLIFFQRVSHVQPMFLFGSAHGIPFFLKGEQHDIVALALACAIDRSEEHTSELQSLMRISYAVFCLKKKKKKNK